MKIGGQFDGTEIETDHVILAVGSVPKPLLDLKFGKRILDTAGMWLLNEQPTKLCVIGAGASGTEIASAFGRLGTEVTLLEALDQILPLEDEDIAKAAAREIRKQNVRIETGAKVEGAEASDSGVKVSFNGESRRVRLPGDRRRPRARRGGARARRGGRGARRPRPDQGGRAAAHVARRRLGDRRHGPRARAGPQGIGRGHHRGGGRRRDGGPPIDYTFIPAVTFCHPQVASFGLTEAAAKEAGYDVVVGKVPMGAVGAPTVYGDRGGMIKIVGDKQYGELIGAHIVSVKAADLIQELVNARELEGGYSEVARIIHPHPSFAEAVMEAARATDGWLIHG